MTNEFPFRIVVLADLSGAPVAPLPRPRERRLIPISRQWFAEFMAAQRARVVLRAGGSASSLGVTFRELADFSAERIAAQIAAQGASENEAEAIAATALLDPTFAALCSAWHGLEFLLRAAETKPNVEIQCWNISKKELLKDLQRAAEFDQSSFFKRVYSEQIGTFGGGAVGCVLADYFLNGGPEDIELAEHVSSVAAAMCAPVLFGVGPQICGLEIWHDLNPEFDPAWFNHSTDHAKFHSLRMSDDSSFVFAALPRFRVEEKASPPTGVWMNTVYLAGAAAAQAFRGDTVQAAGWQVEGEEAIEFECDIQEPLAGNLEQIGLNALNHSKQPGTMTPMQQIIPRRRAGIALAALLRDCRLQQRLHMAARRRGAWSDAESILDNARQWLREAPESAEGNGERYEIRDRGGRLGLQIHDDRPHLASRAERRPWTFGGALSLPPEPEIQTRVHLLAMADFHCGLTRQDRALPLLSGRAVTIDNDNFDSVLKGYYADSSFKRIIPSVFKKGAPIQAEIHFQYLDDFNPEEMLRQIGICRNLLEQRTSLVDVAARADAKRGRWAGLQKACAQPGGVGALGRKLEAWASLPDESDTAPFSRAVLAEDLGEWAGAGATFWEGTERLVNLLLQYQVWVSQDGGQATGEPERIKAALFEIDRLVSAQFRKVMEDDSLLQLERTWRGLRHLVDSAYPTTLVRTFQMDWYSRSLQPTSKSWPVYSRLLKLLGELAQPGFEEHRVVTLFLLDYLFDSTRPGLRSLRRILEVCAQTNLFVICPVTQETAGGLRGDEVLAAPALRRIVAGNGAHRLILVTGEALIREEYNGAGKHAAEFAFNRGCEATPPLYGPGIYRAAAELAEVAEFLLGAARVEDRCAEVRATLNSRGMNCRPLGNAMLIWNEEEE